MPETTKSIGEWADKTFGPGTVPARAQRLLEEVVELVRAADRKDAANVPGEIADCEIVLRTVAHTAGVDLELEVERKMLLNRARRWRRTGDGCGQHVE